MIPYLLLRDSWTTVEDLEVIVMSLKVVEARVRGWAQPLRLSTEKEQWGARMKTGDTGIELTGSVLLGYELRLVLHGR